jgi:Uma2 family endonuclease
MKARTSAPKTVAELLKRLGGVPAARVRLQPMPGTATVEDVVRIHRRTKRLFELVDGVLVEKPMGYYESTLAFELGFHLRSFLRQHDLGKLAGEAGMLKLAPSLVRIPDVSFISWSQFPDRRIPDDPAPAMFPDLAVEILSKTNTRAEMTRKLKEYFLAGTRLVWIIEPKDRTVRVHTAPDASILLTESDSLDGGAVLPGFSLPVRELFTGFSTTVSPPPT